MICKYSLFSLLLVSVLCSATGCGGGTAVGGTAGSAETLSFEGWSDYRTGSYATSESLFKDALSLDPQFSDAYNGLGWLKFQQSGQVTDKDQRNALLADARTNFQKATAADPQNTDAWVGLAGLELQQKNWDKASAAANQALLLNPRYFSSHDNIDYRDVHLILALAYFYLGAFINSEQSADPNNSLYHIDVVAPGYKAYYLANHLTPPDLIVKIGALQGL